MKMLQMQVSTATKMSQQAQQTKRAKLVAERFAFGVSCLALIICSLSLVNCVGAMQLDQVDQNGRSNTAGSGSNSASLALIDNPELTARVLDNLLRSIVFSAPANDYPIINGAQKRGLDLGISRGFSGSQAGKHLMGLSTASFANGPGR